MTPKAEPDSVDLFLAFVFLKLFDVLIDELDSSKVGTVLPADNDEDAAEVKQNVDNHVALL